MATFERQFRFGSLYGFELGPNFQTYDGYLRKALGYSRKYFDDRQVFFWETFLNFQSELSCKLPWGKLCERTK